MKMDDMNKYLEDHGFKVDRKYDSKTGCYTFDVCKDSGCLSRDFKYHDPSSTLTLHTRQKIFLDKLVREFKAHAYYITKEDKDVLDVIKNLKPCKCGGVPEVTVDNDTSVGISRKTIKCPVCGKCIESELYTLEWVITKWNSECTETWPKHNPVQYGMFYNHGRTRINPFEIERVIFNNPATIVFWKDGEKTVVKAIDEPFDEEKGLAMAIAKKAYGNHGNYFNKLKKWLPEIKESCGECEYCDNTDCQNTPTE